METNYIKFDNTDIETANGTGMISTLTHDIQIEAVVFESDNEYAPTHQLFGRSPAGKRIPIGGIWKKENQKGGTYFTLNVKNIGFNANLGKFPKQDDAKNQAIIEWEERPSKAA